MEVTGNTGSTSTNNKIDLTNVREVHVYHEDGSIKETFWFPITPPPPIVIEDSSDTETEEEEEEEQAKEAEEKEKEKTKEGEEEAEQAEEEEEEEEEESNKRQRIGGPAPQRADRSANNRSNDLTPLQPAPSMTANAQEEEPQPSSEVGPPLDLHAPPSPLPELDPTMDIVACMEEHGM